ncbi:UNVERIFIED_CONTAM: hypothetical protein Slati_3909300 [Sesamum latifolium]|uniref:Uncharacterized protein n=1 Tax=Sesamum latifolium TaxID=2727402 RepID=A0AAW2TMV2_9LAMI
MYQTAEGGRHLTQTPPPTTRRSSGLRNRHSRGSFGGILAWVALSHEANRLV